MIVRCDLHIHSALSPCASDDMTPGNILGMAYLNGLDVIAITDHQSCGNIRSAQAARCRLLEEQGRAPLLIPGMELECAEGFHILCYFPSVESAEVFWHFCDSYRIRIANKPAVFGEQIYFDADDAPLGVEKDLLLTSSTLDSITLANEALRLGAALIPAHIDRDSYSILASLGSIPPEFPSRGYELSRNCSIDAFQTLHPELRENFYISGSDAHNLTGIFDGGFAISVPDKYGDELDAPKFVETLRALTLE